jgi:hypothetical protein
VPDQQSPSTEIVHEPEPAPIGMKKPDEQ